MSTRTLLAIRGEKKEPLYHVSLKDRQTVKGALRHSYFKAIFYLFTFSE